MLTESRAKITAMNAIRALLAAAGLTLLAGLMLLAVGASERASAQSTSSSGAPPSAPVRTPPAAAAPAPPRDGQHDFDFEIGHWKSHYRRLLHPLSGSSEWVEYEGTLTARPIWGGRASMDEFESVAPSGHADGMTVQTYDPKTREWRMYSVDGASGVLDPQPMVGKFVNGRGEFFDQEDYQGQSIFVRWVWTASPDSPRWEQAFSVDGGRTWETNRIVTYTRVDRASPTGAPEPLPLPVGAEEAGPRGFDFEIGSWNIHLKRRLHPLTGSTTWVDFDGTSVTRKAWNNRAEIEEFETQNSSGHVVGLTLRLFNPQTHQWRLYWANSDDGRMVEPQIGEIKNGVGEFYAQDIFHDKAILVRFVWTKMNSAVPHFEQAFSDDGGKTWEVNWITDQTRSPAKVAAGE